MCHDRRQPSPARPNPPERDPAAQSAATLRSLFRQRGSFDSVDDEALQKLVERMRPLRYRDGEGICEEGDPGEWTFVVASGEVEVFKKAQDGALIQVNVLQPGDWGGMMSLVTDQPRSAYLTARGDAELRVLDHDDLDDLLEKVPGLAMGLLRCMSRRLGEDAIHLAATLQHVSIAGLDEIHEHCSPQERLMLDTIRHRADAAESLTEIMDFVFDSMCRMGQCDRMTLLFLEEGGSRVVSQWSRATYETLVLRPDYAEDLVGSMLEEAHRSGQPRVIDDLERYSREHPRRLVPRQMGEEGLRSCVAAPLVIGGRTVGFLVRSARKRSALNEHQVRLQRAVAGSINVAVEKAYRIEQLTRANNDYADVLGLVSHELQSPIASMVTDARLLVDGYLGDLTEPQRSKLQRAIRKGEYLLVLVRDLLTLSRVEDPAMKARIESDVDLAEKVVQPAIDMIDSERAARRIKLYRCYDQPMPTVRCDAGLMRIALGNLLRNAVKYGQDNGTIRVTMEAEGDRVRLTVWNEGVGFAEEQRSRLYRKFSRLEDPAFRRTPGTGVGLYSTWRIMQLHGGRVTAKSEHGAWAQFALSWPR